MGEAVALLTKLGMSIALLLGALYLFWTMSANANYEFVQRNVPFYSTHFSSKSGRVILAYEDIAQTGFPFSYSVRLIKPSITLYKGGDTYHFIASYLTLSPVDSDQHYFEIEFPSVVTMYYSKGKQVQETYTLQFRQKPDLYLRGKRIIRTEKEDEVYFGHYGFKMPAKLPVVVANAEGKAREITFNFLTTPQPVFLEIPKKIDQHIMRLIHIMREAVVYTKHEQEVEAQYATLR